MNNPDFTCAGEWCGTKDNNYKDTGTSVVTEYTKLEAGTRPSVLDDL